MNHIIEHLVKEYHHNQDALTNFGKFAVEVYIAYLLERLMENFHDAFGKCLAKAREKVLEGWSVLIGELIPNVRATIKRMSVKLLQAVRR